MTVLYYSWRHDLVPRPQAGAARLPHQHSATFLHGVVALRLPEAAHLLAFLDPSANPRGGTTSSSQKSPLVPGQIWGKGFTMRHAEQAELSPGKSMHRLCHRRVPVRMGFCRLRRAHGAVPVFIEYFQRRCGGQESVWGNLAAGIFITTFGKSLSTPAWWWDHAGGRLPPFINYGALRHGR